MIKLKQDARKAGQQAREKIEIANQLQCTFLIELLIERPDAWNRLFRSDVLLRLVLPVLNPRRKIEKLLKKSIESGPKSGTGEKQALLDRLTSFLNVKLCKMRLSSMPLESPVNVEYASNLVVEIVDEAKWATSKDHTSCCSGGLVLVLRTLPSMTDTLSVASPLADAVSEWSTKRTTRLEASLFNELIVHMPR